MLASLLFSVCVSASSFAASAGGFFLWLWIAHRENAEENSIPALWLLICGVITIVFTVWQKFAGRPMVGLIPVNYNFNAVWMAALAVALAGIAREKPQQRLACGLTAAVLALLVITGSSRSALLGLLVGTAWLTWGHTTRTQRLCALLGLLAAGIVFLPWTLRRLQVGDQAHFYRFKIWRSAVQGAIERPLTGYGLSNFETVYLRHPVAVVEDPVRFGRTTAFAHNEFLQAAADLGWPFFVLLMLISGTVFGRWESSPTQAVLAAIWTGAFFNPIWHLPLLLFLTLLFLPVRRAGSFDPVVPVPRSVFLMSGVVLLSAMIWKGASAYHLDHGQPMTTLSKDCADREEAVRLAPRNIYNQEALGACLEASGQQDHVANALLHYQMARLDAPQRATVDLAIGRLLFREGDPARALFWFRQAQQKEPRYWEAGLWTARCVYALGKHAEALRLLAHLQQEHTAFMQRWARYDIPSDYERRILMYDQRVVEQDRQRMFRR